MLSKTNTLRPLLRTRVFCSFFNMPYYAVVIGSSTSGAVCDNWQTTKRMIATIPKTYFKKFESKIEAEKYLTDLNRKIIDNFEYDTFMAERKAKEDTIETKQAEEEKKLVKSVTKDHIKKIKMSFNALQVAISPLPGLSENCAEQIQTLNDKVAFKLQKILKVQKRELEENESISNKRPKNESQGSENNSGPSLLNKRPRNESQGSQNNSGPSLPKKITTNTVLSPEQKEEAKKAFSYNEKNEVIVYTDGACTNNGSSEASAGAGVWFGMNHFLNMSVKVPGIQTNNCAEIYSAVHAIEQVKASGLTRINIHTDSQFLIKSVTEWAHKWKINGWKTAGGNDVKNKELFVALLEKVKSMDSCTWTYVPGHKGFKGNEEADRLAKAGAKL